MTKDARQYPDHVYRVIRPSGNVLLTSAFLVAAEAGYLALCKAVGADYSRMEVYYTKEGRTTWHPWTVSVLPVR